jgi:ABC-type polysaccharide/polyol phosphate export permease
MSTETQSAPRVFDSSKRPHPFIEEFVELVEYRDLVALWSARNITLRYKRSVLGIGWTLLEPLMMMVIMTFVFSQIFRFATASYPIYVLTGLLLFDFFSRSTSQIIEEVVTSQNLAQRIHVPRSAFALSTIIAFLANWSLALIPLMLLMLFLQVPLTWSLLALPAIMLLVAFFALGVGLIVATLGAFFHDVKLTYGVLLTAWLYATPVIYPIEIVPEQFRRFLAFNPIYHPLLLFRTAVLDGELAPASSWLITTLICLTTAVLGWWLFTRSRQAIEYRV